MARQTFFSFHFERDVWRAGQVRNSWVTQDRSASGFWDKAKWEEVKKKGEAAVHTWIDEQLNGTSVTVVLIGAETANRDYVQYEITQSHKKNNGILGIYINNLKDVNGNIDVKGADPLAKWLFKDSVGNAMTYPTYNWINDKGYENIGKWVEAAAKKAGR